MTYEDFLAAWKKSRQESKPESTPRYVLENVELNGAARDSFAELDFTATVRLLVGERVEVPLGLIGAILQGQPRFTTAGDGGAPTDDTLLNRTDAASDAAQDFVTQDPDKGGVVAHFVGKAGERRRVSLQFIVPLSRDGSESTIQLSCPRAVSSNLKLTTRSPVADANVNVGTLVEQVPVGGGTRLRVVGAAGPVRLTWHSTESAASDFATVLSASGEIRVSIDGRSVRSNARLRVESYGGGFDRLRVRLPPGAQLVPDPAADAAAQRPKYRVIVEAAANGAAGPGERDARQVVRIEFPDKQLTPVTIDLSTEQPIGLEGEGSAVELAGFDVVGAVRQFGDVALEVADDWQARWQIGDHVRQVDAQELAASLQAASLSAAFQYDRQPWSLGVRIETRQTRIHVTPQYEMQIWPDEARLTLRLNYQVYGARAFEFQVRMKGWQISGSPLESGGLVNLDRILRVDDTLTLPLSQASTPRAEITLALRYPLPREAPRFELPLPVPIAASIGTGDLAVRATPDVELLPDPQNSVGLAAVTPTERADPQDMNGALHFRSVLPDAVLVAERRNRAQRVSTEVVSHVVITAAGASVEQQLDYDVQYVPLSALLFETSNELWFSEGQVEVALAASAANDDASAGETPLSIVPAAEYLEVTNSGAATRFRVPLPQPRTGRFTVYVRYRVPLPDAARGGQAWQLPLVRPIEIQETRHRAEIRATRGLTVALDAKSDRSSWKSATSNSGNDLPHLVRTYTADDAQDILPLIVAEADSNSGSGTTVDRIWLQSWYSGGVRQDRMALRFHTAAAQATVELPPQSSTAEIEVLLDGELAEVLSRDRGRIVVRLDQATDDRNSADAASTDYTLELRSRQPIRRGLLTRHELTPPLLVGGRALSQVYWQIVLPSDEHIVRAPRQLSSASHWQWLGSFWGQRPVFSQSELEKWAEAKPQIAPTAAQNEYLYAGLAPVLSIEFITAPRWLIVLASSAVVLAIGLLWIHVPAARRGWIVAAAACSLAVLAIAFPAPAQLLAQAASIGVVAIVLALLLKRAAARPTHWPVIVSGGSSQRQLTPRTDSMLMPPVMSAASTAPTVPLRISDSHQ